MSFLLLGLVGLGLTAFAVNAASSDDDDDEGNGAPTPPEPDETRYGTSADDVLSGRGDDVVAGLKGNDNLTLTDRATGSGNAGSDLLVGDGDSTLYGNLGADVLRADGSATGYGGSGFDFLRGDGDSTLYGGAGNDQMERETGDDATAGNVVFYGDGGDDLIRAQEGSTAYGGEGADRISALRGSVGYGQAGDDRLGAGPGGSVFAGAGDDRLSASSFGDSSLVARADGGAGRDFILAGGLAEVNGGLGADTLVGQVNVINGSSDGLVMSGGAGGDLFIADITRDSDALITISDFDAARDSLALSISGVSGNELASDFTYQGVDVVTGDGFVDLVVRFQQPDEAGVLTDASQTVRLEGLTSFDPATVQFAVPNGDDTYTLMDLVQGTAGADTLDVEGPALVDLGAGADVLTGGDAAHYIFGGRGADSVTLPTDPSESSDSFISLGGGDDSLVGGMGGQIIDGGGGDDSLTLASAETSDQVSTVIDGGNGDDTITITGDFATGGQIDGGTGEDTISASIGQAIFTLDDATADTVAGDADVLNLIYNPDLTVPPVFGMDRFPQAMITGDDTDQVIFDTTGFDGTLHQVNSIFESDGEGATFYGAVVRYVFVEQGADPAAVLAALEAGGSGVIAGLAAVVTLSDDVINSADQPPFGGGEPEIDDFALPTAVLDRAIASVSTTYTLR